MKTTGTNSEVFAAFADRDTGPCRNGKDTIFFRNHPEMKYDVFYSYGTHFPLCYRFNPGHKANSKTYILHIINGDYFSVTTRQHQSDIQSALVDTECFTTSFRALSNAGIDILDAVVIDYTEDQDKYAYDGLIKSSDVPLGATAHKDKEGTIVSWHMAASMVIEYKDNHFICGMDEGSYFVSQLPAQVDSVDAAFEALKPETVRDAEAKGATIKRQGEWYCVRHCNGTQAKKTYKTMAPKFILPRDSEGSNPHTATRGLSEGGKLFISGQLRHPEHAMLRLSTSKAPVIWEVFKNTAIDSWSVSGVD